MFIGDSNSVQNSVCLDATTLVSHVPVSSLSNTYSKGSSEQRHPSSTTGQYVLTLGDFIGF